jgi:hypothetical protein
MSRKSEQIVYLQVRLTEFLRARLAKEAEINMRSMNGEIVHRLAYSLETINHDHDRRENKKVSRPLAQSPRTARSERLHNSRTKA